MSSVWQRMPGPFFEDIRGGTMEENQMFFNAPANEEERQLAVMELEQVEQERETAEQATARRRSSVPWAPFPRQIEKEHPVADEVAVTDSESGRTASIKEEEKKIYSTKTAKVHVPKREDLQAFIEKHNGMEPILVEWDGKDDREHPMGWKISYRWYINVVTAFFTLTSTFASSSSSVTLPNIVQKFGVSEEVARVTTFIYLAGYCLGPPVWGPLSELYGFRWIFIIGGVGLTLFNAVCGVAPNIGSLIIFRILAGFCGACPLTNGGAVVPSILDLSLLGVGIAVFSLAPNVGPCIGPLVGGWIFVSKTYWGWVYFANALFSGLLTVIFLFTVRETYPSICLKKKACRLRKKTGDQRYRAYAEIQRVSIKDILMSRIVSPMLMLIVCHHARLHLLTLSARTHALVRDDIHVFRVWLPLFGMRCSGIKSSSNQQLFDAYPVVFGQLHGRNPVQIGLCFMGFFVGAFMGALFQIFVQNPRYQRIQKEYDGQPVPPEERLVLTMYGGPLLVISLFWFAWTSWPSVSLWSPLVAGGFFGMANYFIFVRTWLHERWC